MALNSYKWECLFTIFVFKKLFCWLAGDAEGSGDAIPDSVHGETAITGTTGTTTTTAANMGATQGVWHKHVVKG